MDQSQFPIPGNSIPGDSVPENAGLENESVQAPPSPTSSVSDVNIQETADGAIPFSSPSPVATGTPSPTATTGWQELQRQSQVMEEGERGSVVMVTPPKSTPSSSNTSHAHSKSRDEKSSTHKKPTHNAVTKETGPAHSSRHAHLPSLSSLKNAIQNRRHKNEKQGHTPDSAHSAPKTTANKSHTHKSCHDDGSAPKSGVRALTGAALAILATMETGCEREREGEREDVIQPLPHSVIPTSGSDTDSMSSSPRTQVVECINDITLDQGDHVSERRDSNLNSDEPEPNSTKHDDRGPNSTKHDHHGANSTERDDRRPKSEPPVTKHGDRGGPLVTKHGDRGGPLVTEHDDRGPLMSGQRKEPPMILISQFSLSSTASEAESEENWGLADKRRTFSLPPPLPEEETAEVSTIEVSSGRTAEVSTIYGVDSEREKSAEVSTNEVEGIAEVGTIDGVDSELEGTAEVSTIEVDSEREKTAEVSTIDDSEVEGIAEVGTISDVDSELEGTAEVSTIEEGTAEVSTIVSREIAEISTIEGKERTAEVSSEPASEEVDESQPLRETLISQREPAERPSIAPSSSSVSSEPASEEVDASQPLRETQISQRETAERPSIAPSFSVISDIREHTTPSPPPSLPHSLPILTPTDTSSQSSLDLTPPTLIPTSHTSPSQPSHPHNAPPHKMPRTSPRQHRRPGNTKVTPPRGGATRRGVRELSKLFESQKELTQQIKKSLSSRTEPHQGGYRDNSGWSLVGSGIQRGSLRKSVSTSGLNNSGGEGVRRGEGVRGEGGRYSPLPTISNTDARVGVRERAASVDDLLTSPSSSVAIGITIRNSIGQVQTAVDNYLLPWQPDDKQARVRQVLVQRRKDPVPVPVRNGTGVGPEWSVEELLNNGQLRSNQELNNHQVVHRVPPGTTASHSEPKQTIHTQRVPLGIEVNHSQPKHTIQGHKVTPLNHGEQNQTIQSHRVPSVATSNQSEQKRTIQGHRVPPVTTMNHSEPKQDHQPRTTNRTFHSVTTNQPQTKAKAPETGQMFQTHQRPEVTTRDQKQPNGDHSPPVVRALAAKFGGTTTEYSHTATRPSSIDHTHSSHAHSKQSPQPARKWREKASRLALGREEKGFDFMGLRISSEGTSEQGVHEGGRGRTIERGRGVARDGKPAKFNRPDNSNGNNNTRKSGDVSHDWSCDLPAICTTTVDRYGVLRTMC